MADQLTIDARGLACPEPVLRARAALAKSAAAEIAVLVDNDAAIENVSRTARAAGCELRVEDRGGHTAVVLVRGAAAAGAPAGAAADAVACCGAPRVAVLLASATIGHGDDDLGRLLMIAFVKTLKSLDPRPRTLLLMNGGVRLAAEGSELVDALRELEAEGAELLVCGTCLDFFRLKEKLRAGRVSNMFEIASRLVAADRVLRP
jgi:tRNA 2-thiouridine synthesizing protein A